MVYGKRRVVERLIQHEAKLSAVSPSRLYSLSGINHTIYKKKCIICDCFEGEYFMIFVPQLLCVKLLFTKFFITVCDVAYHQLCIISHLYHEEFSTFEQNRQIISKTNTLSKH